MKDKKALLIELFEHEDYKPLKEKEIAMLLQVPMEERHVLTTALTELISEGKIMRTKKGKYLKPKQLQLIVGKYIGHPKGFGFVTIEGEDQDLFIPGKFTNGAFNGDTVAVKLLPGTPYGKRKEGQVMEIINRGMNRVVGTYQKSMSFGFVISDNKKFDKDVFISKANDLGAMNGHKVVVEITDFGDDARKPEGKIVEIIGHINEPGTDILSIVKSLGIPSVFPDPVLEAATEVPDTVPEADKSGRLDLRQEMTVTIDGEDAKDLDDAITIKAIEGGYQLGVHIADVTHYVTEGSALDEEALVRGTSVYLADRVIPMLPRRLSNGICSLNAGVDRLALSCIMDVDHKGKVTNYDIRETVINVNHRMTYTNVRKILQNEDLEVTKIYEDAYDMFMHMELLAKILHSKRTTRGSIDFDFPESKIILDEMGKPVEIKQYERNVATRIIEEFMLLANETVAEHFYWQQMPFVYRSHEEPDPDKIKRLSAFIRNFGYKLKGNGEVHPKELQKLLDEISGSNEELIISRLTLRSMQKAAYTTTADGHYGLAADYYSHFTSPIRRYPDLQIHRIIKEAISGEMVQGRIDHYNRILPKIVKDCSEFERRAEEAERETIKLKKVEYMVKHVGEVFEGVISSVTSFGLFIELDNTIEGLVHVTALDDDYYVYDEDHYQYIGEKAGNIYKLGQKVSIKVTRADVVQRLIDFELYHEN